MKKNRAFTLIELLAIIVILAIIAVITVPIILNIIENSRKGAATASAYGYKDAVNKYYVTELANNRQLQLEGLYTVTDGILNGSGITNKEILVSGDKPSGGYLNYSNNTLTGGCLTIGDYKVLFENGQILSTKKGICKSIGDSIIYSTTLNGQILNNWRVFYVEGDYTYIILDDYLPREAINNNMKTTYNLSGGAGTTYTIKSTTNGTDLINAITIKSNWNSLLTGTLNGSTIDYSETTNPNIFATGAPDINLLAKSWNSASNGFTTTMTPSNDANGYSINGSFVLNLSSDRSKGNYSLYVPHVYTPSSNGIDSCYGYWLATPKGDYGMFIVDHYSNVRNANNNDNNYAFRPVIKLPTNVVNQ